MSETKNETLHEIAGRISGEIATRDGNPIIINDREVTVAEVILRSWATSKNPKLQQAFVEIAFGKELAALKNETEKIAKRGSPPLDSRRTTIRRNQ